MRGFSFEITFCNEVGTLWKVETGSTPYRQCPHYRFSIVMVALNEELFKLLKHTPHLLGLDPSDSRNFRKLKKHLRGMRRSPDNEVTDATYLWFAEVGQIF